MTSRVTLYRAKMHPEKALAENLYELAFQSKTSMEALMGKPLYLCQRLIDGIIEQEGIYYAYKTELPYVPPKYSMYVFQLEDRSIIVSRRNKVKTYHKVIGIVTLEIRKTPI